MGEQNSTLQHYTHYQPQDLYDCVKDLHRLCSNSHSSSLPAIRDKYSQHKVSKVSPRPPQVYVVYLLCFLSKLHSLILPQYKYAAKKHCPPLIPQEFFCNWKLHGTLQCSVGHTSGALSSRQQALIACNGVLILISFLISKLYIFFGYCFLYLV